MELELARTGGDANTGANRPQVISEELFRGVLLRERRRVDRSNQLFAVILVTGNPLSGAHLSSMWGKAGEALTAATRQTDVVGWVEAGAVIGILLTEVNDLSAQFADDIDDRIRRELAKRFDPQAVAGFSIRLRVNPELKPTSDGAPIETNLSLEVWPTTTSYDVVKRGLDIVGSLTLLFGLSPVLLLIAGLVKLKSPGPVFYKQERVGQGMKTFTMLKFRTMQVNADHSIHHEFVTTFIKAGAQAAEPGTEPFFKVTNDPRVTGVGRVLRKTSLDELPQLWNVLIGQMSLVGPRPPLPYELEQYQPWHQRRVLEAKPGITGLWQVAGRSRTTFDEMVRLDLRYAKHRSLWTDLKILVATPGAVISGRGAC
jgi:lipopolysaccharide/colanic/teichoic acid biosynthesis glycosyltransferase